MKNISPDNSRNNDFCLNWKFWFIFHTFFFFFQVLDDWKYIAMVLDRLLLYIFLAVTFGGTVGILMNAPHIFEYVDQDAIIAAIMNENDGNITGWASGIAISRRAVIFVSTGVAVFSLPLNTAATTLLFV